MNNLDKRNRLCFGLGTIGVWIAMALDEIFRAVIMLIRWRGSRWMNKRIATQEQ